jgi:hypothetical protein
MVNFLASKNTGQPVFHRCEGQNLEKTREKHPKMPHFGAEARNFTDQIYLRRCTLPPYFHWDRIYLFKWSPIDFDDVRSSNAMQLRVMREPAVPAPFKG